MLMDINWCFLVVYEDMMEFHRPYINMQVNRVINHTRPIDCDDDYDELYYFINLKSERDDIFNTEKDACTDS